MKSIIKIKLFLLKVFFIIIFFISFYFLLFYLLSYIFNQKEFNNFTDYFKSVNFDLPMNNVEIVSHTQTLSHEKNLSYIKKINNLSKNQEKTFIHLGDLMKDKLYDDYFSKNVIFIPGNHDILKSGNYYDILIISKTLLIYADNGSNLSKDGGGDYLRQQIKIFKNIISKNSNLFDNIIIFSHNNYRRKNILNNYLLTLGDNKKVLWISTYEIKNFKTYFQSIFFEKNKNYGFLEIYNNFGRMNNVSININKTNFSNSSFKFKFPEVDQLIYRKIYYFKMLFN